jgi:hypothetical protein
MKRNNNQKLSNIDWKKFKPSENCEKLKALEKGVNFCEVKTVVLIKTWDAVSLERRG